MKVIYLDIRQAILDAIDAANRLGRKIDYIELSLEEWEELCKQVGNLNAGIREDDDIYFGGVRLIVKP